MKGQRWSYRVGKKRQGPLGSLAAALAAAGVGLIVGAVIGTEAGSTGGPREVSSSASPGSASEAPMPAASFEPAVPPLVDPAAALLHPVQKIAGDFDINYEVRLPYEEPLPEEERAIGNQTPYDYPITDEALTTIVVPDKGPVADPLWQRHAVAMPGLNGRPVIAMVIDDLGLSRTKARRAIGLPAPLTLSFLTYAEGLEGLTASARDAGHEILVHVPMEPRDLRWDPGPNALLVGLPEDELERRLEWALGRFEGYVGINNHMGSRFTTSLLGMAQVMAALKSRGLLFLDSLTAGSSVGMSLARRLGVPHVGRDIFIDNTPDDARSIWRQLRKLERVARRRGEAIGIGHPHDMTLEVLARWIPEAERRGFVLVPLTTVVERTMETAARDAGTQ